ncbi:hypothetical protein DL93DRAFT_405421 [Clavulina sp. PMI_390]|nr:hypothetical protein DL93DRAFT_405421 [Clavulina sp. PMI_390]
MPYSAFEAINDALDSIKGLLLSAVESTPIILLHPPSNRLARMSTLQNDILILNTYENELSKLCQRISDVKMRILRQRAGCTSALTPMAGMPIELMLEIFRLAASDSSSTITIIASVCSSWRAIALGHPSLWANINLSVGGKLHEAIARYRQSHSIPLRLKAEDKPTDWCSDLFESLPDLEGRLETLHWDSSSDVSDFLNADYSPGELRFTALHTLIISLPKSCKHCRTWWTGLDHVDPLLALLDSASFPALRNLDITRSALELPLSILPQLQHLRLDCVQMGIGTYRDTLRHTRSLKSLIIANALETQLFFQQDPVRSEDLYVLPQIETLQLSSNPVVLVEKMLKNFRYPSLVTLHLSNVIPSNLNLISPIRLSDRLGNTFAHTPNLSNLIITESNSDEICFLTTPLRTHAFQLRRLIFSTRKVITAESNLISHLKTIVDLRQMAGAHPLEIETSKASLPFLKEALDGTVHLVASVREDCRTGVSERADFSDPSSIDGLLSAEA